MSEVAAPSSSAPSSGGESQVSNTQTPAPNEAAKPVIAKRQVIDLGDEKVDIEEIKRDRQKWRGADGKFREASAKEKSIQENLALFSTDPETAIERLEKLGISIDRKGLGERLLRKAIEAELMDPKDREIAARDAELQKYKAREEDEKKSAEERRKAQLREHKKEELSKVFGEALAASPLSKDPDTAAAMLREMAMYYRLSKQQGRVPDAKELAEHVSRNRISSYAAIANSLEGDDLIAHLGEEVVKKIRKADFARYKQNIAKPNTAPTWEQTSAPVDGKRKFIDPYDARMTK